MKEKQLSTDVLDFVLSFSRRRCSQNEPLGRLELVKKHIIPLLIKQSDETEVKVHFSNEIDNDTNQKHVVLTCLVKTEQRLVPVGWALDASVTKAMKASLMAARRGDFKDQLLTDLQFLGLFMFESFEIQEKDMIFGWSGGRTLYHKRVREEDDDKNGFTWLSIELCDSHMEEKMASRLEVTGTISCGIYVTRGEDDWVKISTATADATTSKDGPSPDDKHYYKFEFKSKALSEYLTKLFNKRYICNLTAFSGFKRTYLDGPDMDSKKLNLLTKHGEKSAFFSSNKPTVHAEFGYVIQLLLTENTWKLKLRSGMFTEAFIRKIQKERKPDPVPEPKAAVEAQPERKDQENGNEKDQEKFVSSDSDSNDSDKSEMALPV